MRVTENLVTGTSFASRIDEVMRGCEDVRFRCELETLYVMLTRWNQNQLRGSISK